MTRIKYFALALLLGAAPTFAAHPGFVDLKGIEAHSSASPTFAVTLGDWILGFGEEAMEDDPELAALRGLESLQVRIYEKADAGLLDAMKAFGEDLGRAGWQPVVTVNDGRDRVRVMMKPDGANIAGVTILVHGGGHEAVMVNAYGSIRPEDLGRLISGMGDVGDVDLAEVSESVSP